MSRSVYDPPPDWKQCPMCKQDTDEAYYGKHICQPMVQSYIEHAVKHYGVAEATAMLAAAVKSVAKERAEAELMNAEAELERVARAASAAQADASGLTTKAAQLRDKVAELKARMEQS